MGVCEDRDNTTSMPVIRGSNSDIAIPFVVMKWAEDDTPSTEPIVFATQTIAIFLVLFYPDLFRLHCHVDTAVVFVFSTDTNFLYEFPLFIVAVLESSWSPASGEPPKACMSPIKVPISVFCPKRRVNTARSLCKFELRPIVLMIALSLWFMQNRSNKVTSNWPVQETLAIITITSTYIVGTYQKFYSFESFETRDCTFQIPSNARHESVQNGIEAPSYGVQYGEMAPAGTWGRAHQDHEDR